MVLILKNPENVLDPIELKKIMKEIKKPDLII